MKIYTKTGDDGTTGLFGGQRVRKDDLRIEAYGTIDELNSILGIAHCRIEDEEIKAVILQVQNQLFTVGSDLATPPDTNTHNFEIPRVDESFITFAESRIDIFEARLPELRSFILPGGSTGSSYLHLARTVCRRAERRITNLQAEAGSVELILVYLNRLSDLFFVLARYENSITGTPDIKWTN